MKAVVIGAGHWHLKYFVRAVLELPHVELVGVSDPSRAVAARAGAQLRCEAYTDFRRLCADKRPQLAIVLGRHVDMPDVALHLMHEGIPFALEKPGGVSAADVEFLAAESRRLGAFASASFGFRASDMFAKIEQIAGGERLLNMSVKAYGGSPWRYPSHAPWMLEPTLSGGGAFINLGFHYVQLFRLLASGPVDVHGAAMSSAGYRLPIEEYAAVQLRSGDAYGTIETGYCYPGPGSDEHFSFRTEGHYFVVAGRSSTHIQVADVDAVDDVLRSGDPDRVRTMNGSADLGGAVRLVEAETDRFPPSWGADLVRRVTLGEPPLEGLDDMAEVMRLVEAAYAAAGRSHPLPSMQ